MVPCGDAEVIADQMAHGFDAPSYLRAMDAQGIDAVVLYPSIGLFVPFQPELDAAQSAAACRSYNDWLAAYCAEDERRMAGVGLVPLADVEHWPSSRREHAAGLGLVGVLARPNHLYGRNLGDPAYDPLHAVSGRGRHGPGRPRGPRSAGTDHRRRPLRRASPPATSCRTRWSRWRPWPAWCSTARWPATRACGSPSSSRGPAGCPYWLHRLDEHQEWMDPGAEPAPAALRPPVRDLHRGRRRPDRPRSSTGWAPTTWSGPATSPTPTPCSPTPPPPSSPRPGRQGISEPDLATVLWDSPLAFYALGDRFDLTPISSFWDREAGGDGVT